METDLVCPGCACRLSPPEGEPGGPLACPKCGALIPAVQPLTDRTDAGDPGEPSPPNAIQEPGGEADLGSEGLLPGAFPPTTAKSRVWLAVPAALAVLVVAAGSWLWLAHPAESSFWGRFHRKAQAWLNLRPWAASTDYVVKEHNRRLFRIPGTDTRGFKARGYIDRAGNVVIPPRFGVAHDFDDGVAIVHDDVLNSQPYYVDETGRMIRRFAPGGQIVGVNWRLVPFSDGLGLVGQFKDDGKMRGGMGGYGQTDFTWSYIDATGKTVLQPGCEMATGFSEGLAAVRVNNKWGYIDKTGALVIQPQFLDDGDPLRAPGRFSEGLAAVPLSDGAAPWSGRSGRLGYIDRTGKVVFECRPGAAQANPFRDLDFSCGYVVFQGERVIDRDGREVVKPPCHVVAGFREGLALMKINEQYGFVDTRLREVIPPQFAEAGNFSEGLAWVRVKDKYGYIDRRGKLVIPPSFTHAEDFHGGLAVVDGWCHIMAGQETWASDRMKYIDRTGRAVWPRGSGITGTANGI